MSKPPVFVVVSGGVVQDVPDFVEVIDFDNLLGDGVSPEETLWEWGVLSADAKKYVETCYEDEHKKIQARIKEVTG